MYATFPAYLGERDDSLVIQQSLCGHEESLRIVPFTGRVRARFPPRERAGRRERSWLRYPWREKRECVILRAGPCPGRLARLRGGRGRRRWVFAIVARGGRRRVTEKRRLERVSVADGVEDVAPGRVEDGASEWLVGVRVGARGGGGGGLQCCDGCECRCDGAQVGVHGAGGVLVVDSRVDG